MKIQIEIQENLTEEEIIIRSKSLHSEIQNVGRAIADALSVGQRLTLYRGDTAYYLPPFLEAARYHPLH